MRAVLINPVTGETLQLHAAKPPKPGAPGRGLFEALVEGPGEQKGMPPPLAAALCAALGQPRQELGTGSFALVMVDPTDSRRVLKFTVDEMDAHTAAFVGEEQKAGRFDGLVRIDSALFMPFTSAGGDEARMWIIRAERIVPLVNAAHHDVWPNYVGETVHGAFYSTLKQQVQEPVLRHMGWGDWRKGYAVVPPALRRKMLEGLAQFGEALEGRARKLDFEGAMDDFEGAMDGEKAQAASALNAASTIIDELIREKLPIIDLHPGNWGFRDPEDPASIVITDFGLSSLGNKRLTTAKRRTGLVLHPPPRRRRRRVDPRQMLLFENPNLRKRVLTALRRYGPQTMNELAKRLGVRPYYIDKTLHSLWSAGHADASSRLAGKRKFPTFSYDEKWELGQVSNNPGGFPAKEPRQWLAIITDSYIQKLPREEAAKRTRCGHIAGWVQGKVIKRCMVTQQVGERKDDTRLRLLAELDLPANLHVKLKPAQFAKQYPDVQRNPDLSHKELVALSRYVLGGIDALRTKGYRVDAKTVRALFRKGYFTKKGVSEAGRKLVKSLGVGAPLF